MKSATALAARPAPQPLSSQSEVCPGQVPLPIGGFPPVTDIASQSRPDASLRQRSGQFAQVIAEVLSGLRPARQVQSWLSPQVYNQLQRTLRDRKSTRLNSSHVAISYAVFCLKKKKKTKQPDSAPTRVTRQPI